MAGKEPQASQGLGTQDRKLDLMGACRQYKCYVQETGKGLFLCIKDYGSGSQKRSGVL